MYKKFLGLSAAFGLAATIGLASYAQYFPPSGGGGGTGPTTNPVSLAQGGTGQTLTGGGSTSLFFNQSGTFTAPASGGTLTPSSSGQLAIFTGSTTAAGNSQIVFSTSTPNSRLVIGDGTANAGSILLQGGGSSVPEIIINGQTSGNAVISAAGVAGTSGGLILPTTSITMNTAAASVNNSFQLLSTGGIMSSVSPTAATALLNNVTSSTAGLAPAGGGSTTVFLNGNGAYSTPSATAAAGSSSDIQFNNGGVLGADASFTYSVGANFSDLTVGSASGSGALVLASDASGIRATKITMQNAAASGILTISPSSVASSPTYIYPSVNVTEETALPALNGSPVLESTAGSRSHVTGVTFTASNGILGVTGGTGGSLTLLGATSGQNTISVAAAAGTGITFVLPTVAYTGATSQATATANIPIRNTSGAESFPAGLLGAANSLTVGASGTAGSVTINSTNASSNTVIKSAAIASGVVYTLPVPTVTEVNAAASVGNSIIIQQTSGQRSYLRSGGSQIDISAPTAISTSQTLTANTTYSATGTFTATLPSAVGGMGGPITVYMPGTSVMTVNTTSSQTVGGSASGVKSFTSAAATPIVLLFESDNVNWHYTQGL